MLDPTDRRSNDDMQRVIDTLQRVAKFTSEVSNLRSLLTSIMEETAALMLSEASACMLYDEATDELFFEVATGEKADTIKSIRLKSNDGFAGACFQEKRTLIVNDVKQDNRHFVQADMKSHFKTRNLIATPILYRDEQIGVLEVLNTSDSRDYTRQDAKIMEIIAGHAAVAVTNARLIEQSIRQERLEAIGMAVSGIAHHLKNVIVTLKGPIGLMRMGIENDNKNLLTTSLPILERGARRMEHSVQEMLDYSKERKPECTPGELNELIREIISGSEERSAKNNVTLRMNLDNELPITMLDQGRLHDAILNLIGNAIEAHSAKSPNAFVEIRTSLSSNRGIQIIEVEDNGPGIEEDKLPLIFQPFYSTKGSKGTGLGLAVTQKVIEENGGILDVRSIVGKGTTFTIQIPVQPVTAREANESADDDA